MAQKSPLRVGRISQLFILLFVLGGYSAFVLLKPLPLIQPELSKVTRSTQTLSGDLPWPSYGQAAVGILGADVVAQNGKQESVPIASVSKVVTALVLLEKKPLKLGETGPTIKLGPADVALYNEYVAKEGSVVPVNNGELITQYQALQAIMLPSANNMADSMAIWAFGSLKAYSEYANQYIKKLGMANSVIGDDASGFSPTTKSTTRDLVKLGQEAMKNPVLAEIVGTPDTTNVPVAGRVFNGNSLLGTNGIVGIKTGTTVQAGGVFLGAARTTVNKKRLTIITAVAGAPNRLAALTDTIPLTEASQKNFDDTQLIGSNDAVGSYRTPWSSAPEAIAPKGLSVLSWKGLAVPITVTLDQISYDAKPGDVVGKITADTSLLAGPTSIDAVLQKAPSKPSVWWRLTHPLF